MFKVRVEKREGWRGTGSARIVVRGMHELCKELRGTFNYELAKTTGGVMGEDDRNRISMEAAKYFLGEYISTLSLKYEDNDLGKLPIDWTDMYWNKEEKSILGMAGWSKFKYSLDNLGHQLLPIPTEPTEEVTYYSDMDDSPLPDEEPPSDEP